VTAGSDGIPTLDRTVSEQADLGRLCADRALRTDEVFAPNAYYGFDWVLKRYAGLPDDRPLKVVIPHGIELNEAHVWQAEATAPLPAVLCYSPRQLRAYAERSRKIGLLSSTPFLHVAALVGPPSETRRGTLFFLSHSTHHITAVSPFEQLAEQLQALPERFHPISVCVYWRDFLLGHHLEFERRGMRIVSSGHMYDRHFLVRLHHLCSLHRYACSNEIGSHLFYSMAAGCSYFQLGANAELHYDQARRSDVATIPDPIRVRIEQLFATPHDTPTQEQRMLIDDYVGRTHELGRDDMSRLLSFCEQVDRFGTATWRDRRYFMMPRSLHRRLWLGPRLWLGRLRRALPRPTAGPRSKVSA
jgi:hypothetical protein